MKCHNPKVSPMTLIVTVMFMLLCMTSHAQFQNLYGLNGASTDEYFHRVIPYSQGFYLTGVENNVAYVSHIDLNGNWDWTSRLNMPSLLTDAKVIPGSDDLLFIGLTLNGSSNQSIIGQIDRFGLIGCLNILESPGSEGLIRMDANPGGSYTVVGFQTDPITLQDVVILDISPNCVINSKRIFLSSAFDEFANDIEVIGTDFYVAGIVGGGANIYRTSLAGTFVGGVRNPVQYSYDDIEETSGDLLAIANPTGAGQPRIMRFDPDLLVLWEISIFGVSRLEHIVENNGDIYVVGTATVAGLSRSVIFRIDDSSGPQIVWAKYIDDSETSFAGGSLAILSGGDIAYADAREHLSGFGNYDAFFTLTDEDLTTTCTQELTLDFSSEFTLYESPIEIDLEFYDVPPFMGGDAVSLEWDQLSICASDSCQAAFTFTIVDDCGTVSFTDQSFGTPALQYCWDFDGNLTTCESILPNPTWQFPGPPCQSWLVCLTITAADGCTDTYCDGFTIFDNIPPVINCPPDLSLACDDDVSPITTGFANALDNCTLSPTIVYSDVLFGNIPCDGFIEREWTATDDCGNSSTCIQIIMIIDNTPPLLSNCPPDMTINVPGNPLPCQSNVTIPIPVATDYCSLPVTMVNDYDGDPDASGLYPVGTTTVTWTATDDCGNTATCSMNVTVNCTPDECCTDSLAFVLAAQNVQTFGTLGDCELSFAADGLTDCMQITYYWGDPLGSSTGPISNNNVPVSFTYPGPGTYVACYQIDELLNGDTCWSFIHCDTLEVFCDSSIFKCGMAVITCFSGFLPAGSNNTNPNGPVLALVDVRNHATAPLGVNWTALTNSSSGLVHLSNWESKDMGQIFGVTIDNNYNVYTAATTMFGHYLPTGVTNSVFGNVYKIDRVTGTPAVFATLPQDPIDKAGLGDVWYDMQYNQIFVSNFYDGLIYRYDMNNVFLGTYDFPGISLGVPSPGFIPRGQRVWAIATHQGKLYFSVWVEDRNRIEPTLNNQIWSVQLNPASTYPGEPIASTLVKEKDISDLVNNFSSPISDISFSDNGTMLIAERSMNNDFGDAKINPSGQAHASRILELVGPGWTEKRFYVGNPPQHNHAAGGIDYGYDSFDPAVSPLPLLCDSMVWGTGDALRFAGYNVIPDPSSLPGGGSTGDYVYGVTGIRQSGNSNNPTPPGTYVKNSSIYIDADNDIASGDKIQIGDIDIFKKCIECTEAPSVPCDSLMVMITPDTDEPCCYTIDIKNLFGPNISKLKLDLLTPGVIFNTSQINTTAGFQYAASNSDHTLCITHSSGSIPPNTSTNIIRFCYSGVDAPGENPQYIKYTWLQNVGGSDVPTECMDTLVTHCPPVPKKDTCIFVNTLDVDCNPSNPFEYILTFNVTNLSSNPSFNAYIVNLYGLPPGFSFSPCIGTSVPITSISIPIPGAPLSPGQTSANMCVKIISSTPILNPVTICAQAKLMGIEACCTTDDKFCFTLEPCCDPCGDIGIVSTQFQQDSACCYSFDVINDCPYPYFTKIEAEILTGGVTYGYYAIATPFIGLWSMTNNASSSTGPTKLTISPNGGTIPGGTLNSLFAFCLDNITSPSQVPQYVAIRWITPDINGQDSIACDTILEFDCEHVIDYDCVLIDSISIICLPGQNKYMLTFQVTNQSTILFNATSLDMILLAPSDLVFFPSSSIPLSPTLGPGQSQNVSTCLLDTDGLPGGGNIVFIPKLSFLAGDTCCFEGIPVNIPLPPCDTCVCHSNLTISSGNSEFPVFCDPHMGFIPSFGCPADTVIISGFFGCGDSTTWEPCEETEVQWTLFGPDNTPIDGGITSNYTVWLFPPSLVGAAGPYSLTLWTFCPGSTDTCICDVSWVQEPCNPCTCPGSGVSGPNLVVNGDFSLGDVGFTSGQVGPGSGNPCVCTDGTYCVSTNFTSKCTGWPSVSDHTGDLAANFLIVDGNDGSPGSLNVWTQSVNIQPCMTYCFSFWTASVYNTPFNLNVVVYDVAGNPVSPLFGTANIVKTSPPWSQQSFTWTAPCNASGPFTIAINQVVGDDETDFGIDDICLSKVDSPPDSCECGTLEWAEVYNISPLPQSIFCDTTAVIIPCRKFGPEFFIHGNLTCVPDSCGPDVVSWTLDRPGTLADVSGISFSSPYPHFDIGIPWSHFSQAGSYTFTVTRNCGSKLCSCKFNFIVESCPCGCDDLEDDVDKGFVVTGNKNSCNRKFKPVALCPGDEVTWIVNGPGLNSSFGPTVGNASTSVTFPSPGGTYTVCMVVTRFDPITGDTCTLENCRNVLVKCHITFPNDTVPHITLCPGGDRLRNGDFSEDLWVGHLGSGGSVEGWELFPNPGRGIVLVDSSGASDEGQVVLIGGFENFAGIVQRVRINGTSAFIGMNVNNYLGDLLPAGTVLEFRIQDEPIPGSPSHFTYRHVLDTSVVGWTEISIEAPISIAYGDYYLVICVQNDSDGLLSVVGIDNVEFCTEKNVGTTAHWISQDIRVFPNPNTGEFTVDLSDLGTTGTSLRIISLTGQLLSEHKIENSNPLQNVDASMLPEGMYILQIISEGRVTAVSKFVKM